MTYCKSYFNYNRRQTLTVQIGSLMMGGLYPIRIQTMANTDTNDIEASVAQAKRVVNSGAQLLRYTTQGVREANSLGEIHNLLRAEGINIPLVADVHFNPKVAEVAATMVEKVRINPGNFVNNLTDQYTEEQYQEELNRVEEKLIPLINICRQRRTAIRIGVNHGSLSPRIVSRYGDTPQGLAASCIEFIELCHKHHFDNLVISVKASNTLVMVHAVRLLVRQMQQLGVELPLHLGVTEAGAGEDGRIKSAVGIGALLADGIGATVRVSLSEDPEFEIPVAKQLVNYIVQRKSHEHISASIAPQFNPYQYKRRLTHAIENIGGTHLPVVISEYATTQEPRPDIIFSESKLQFVSITYPELTDEKIEELKNNKEQVLLLSSNHQNPVGEMRAFFNTLIIHQITNPVILCANYQEAQIESLQIKAAADLGVILLDGFGDGIFLQNQNSDIAPEVINSIAFAILQASRVRISRTEYISCPGCGRTRFDLQKAVQEVKNATAHLKHLKIAVMGCIVNGPGEMADADYGYVGAGQGKISLYRGQQCIEKNIPQEQALEHLLKIIEEDRK